MIERILCPLSVIATALTEAMGSAANQLSLRGMGFIRQFGVVLLLVSYLTPAMACMISDVPMTSEERACCRMMHDQCDQMGMSASHGCCQKAPLSAHDNALDIKAAQFHPIAIAPIWLTASDLLNPTPTVAGAVESPDHSPPAFPPTAVSVLRI
jgi:hypothetical protein